MDLRSIQKPLKEKYRSDPNSSRITLRAHGAQSDTPIACSVEVGQALFEAQAHSGVGGAGTAACSGDLLLGALAACAQLTCQLVAEAMGIPFEHIRVDVEGEMDLRGHSRQVRYKRTTSDTGTTGRAQRENGTVLCCHANPDTASANKNELVNLILLLVSPNPER